jgi:hypothetical protein
MRGIYYSKPMPSMLKSLKFSFDTASQTSNTNISANSKIFSDMNHGTTKVRLMKKIRGRKSRATFSLSYENRASYFTTKNTSLFSVIVETTSGQRGACGYSC